MKISKIVVALTAALMTAAWVSASDMTLTRTGDLYRFFQTEDGLVVSYEPAGGSGGFDLPVPQTSAVETSYLDIAVDETTGNIYLIWQQGEAPAAELKVACLVDETWDGPVTLAGGDGSNAVYPQFLLYKKTFEYTIGEGEDTETFTETATFLHLAWWSFYHEVADGTARLGTLTLDPAGIPDYADFSPIQLSGMLPFGIGCAGIDDAPDLAHPQLYVDPETGNPVILATDFTQCLVMFFELTYKDIPELEIMPKRRRRVTIFGRSRMVPFSRMPPLATVKVEPARDMSVIFRWDKEAAVDFMTLEEYGWSDLRSLTIGDHLSRTEAVDLIRTLAR